MFKALKDVTCEIANREYIIFFGPSGCGKSTIIRALARIIPLQNGRILVAGRDITGIPISELARLIGVVPQMPLLPSIFTALEIVLMGRNPHLGLFQSESRRDWALAWEAMLG